MLFIRQANMTGTPVELPGRAQLAGNMVQYSLVRATSQPPPFSMYGSLRRSAVPWPFYLDAGSRQAVQQVMPPKSPPGWLPQGTYRFFGRNPAQGGNP